MKFVFRAAALEESREAIAWYLQEAGQRQADAFRDEVNAKLTLLMEHPGIGTPGEWGTRWMPLRVFPLHTALPVGRRHFAGVCGCASKT